MCELVLHHYHTVFLPVVSALDNQTRLELSEAIKEIDYLVETLCHAELNPVERQETELVYWAWWEKVRSQIEK